MNMTTTNVNTMNTTLATINPNCKINGSHQWSISASNEAGSIGVSHHPILPVITLTIWNKEDRCSEFPTVTRRRCVAGKTPAQIKVVIYDLMIEAMEDSAVDEMSEYDGLSYGSFMRVAKDGSLAKSRVQTKNVWDALTDVKDQLFNELPQE